MLPLTTFYRSGAHRSDVYKWDAFVTSWRFYNRAWQPRRHDRLPETSGTLWIHRGALTNQRCSLATGCGIKLLITKIDPIVQLWIYKNFKTLQWRHNGRDSVSNHQPHDCFLNRLFRHRSKKTSKLRVTGLCAGNTPEAGELPSQMASNAENVSIWWRQHEDSYDVFANIRQSSDCSGHCALWSILLKRPG